MVSLTYLQILRGNRFFRRLLAGQVISELGNWFNFIASLGLVRAASASNPEATAILLVARLAPFALFAPLAGAAVDRWSRRTVMIAADLLRAVAALGMLLVRGPEDLWIAYASTVVSTLLAAFFEAAKNAATPNITGEDGLLAGNALMFSTRFLLMSAGAGLGGAASSMFGYEVAFIINSASFIVSAWSIWAIPDAMTREAPRDEHTGATGAARPGFWHDIHEGWSYIAGNRLVAALIGVNILWATGGGMINLVFDRLGGVVFASQTGIRPDASVAIFYVAAGFGLFIGMMLARRAGAYVEMRRLTVPFVGWMVIIHGLLFAAGGVTTNMTLSVSLMFVSRALIGLEYAYQDTLLMRLLPDTLRGRVSITDRAAEILVMSMATAAAGWAVTPVGPRVIAVVSGVLTASPGLVWLLMFAFGRLTLPERLGGPADSAADHCSVSAEAELASDAGAGN